MCQFNTGCPGIESDDGFVPCTLETGCASGQIEVSFADARRLGMSVSDIKDRFVGHNRVRTDGWRVPANTTLNLPEWFQG